VDYLLGAGKSSKRKVWLGSYHPIDRVPCFEGWQAMMGDGPESVSFD